MAYDYYTKAAKTVFCGALLASAGSVAARPCPSNPTNPVNPDLGLLPSNLAHAQPLHPHLVPTYAQVQNWGTPDTSPYSANYLDADNAVDPEDLKAPKKTPEHQTRNVLKGGSGGHGGGGKGGGKSGGKNGGGKSGNRGPSSVSSGSTSSRGAFGARDTSVAVVLFPGGNYAAPKSGHAAIGGDVQLDRSAKKLSIIPANQSAPGYLGNVGNPAKQREQVVTFMQPTNQTALVERLNAPLVYFPLNATDIFGKPIPTAWIEDFNKNITLKRIANQNATTGLEIPLLNQTAMLQSLFNQYFYIPTRSDDFSAQGTVTQKDKHTKRNRDNDRKLIFVQSVLAQCESVVKYLPKSYQKVWANIAQTIKANPALQNVIAAQPFNSSAPLDYEGVWANVAVIEKGANTSLPIVPLTFMQDGVEKTLYFGLDVQKQVLRLDKNATLFTAQGLSMAKAVNVDQICAQLEQDAKNMNRAENRDEHSNKLELGLGLGLGLGLVACCLIACCYSAFKEEQN